MKKFIEWYKNHQNRIKVLNDSSLEKAVELLYYLCISIERNDWSFLKRKCSTEEIQCIKKSFERINAIGAQLTPWQADMTAICRTALHQAQKNNKDDLFYSKCLTRIQVVFNIKIGDSEFLTAFFDEVACAISEVIKEKERGKRLSLN